MKHYLTLTCLMLLALPAAAQRSYPLGSYLHPFLMSDGIVKSSGWDPTWSLTHQPIKDRLVAGVSTFPVGLPNGKQPEDLGNTHCPASTTIDDSSDVAGLPQISLSGVSGPVYLIADCDASGSTLIVQNGYQVAVWGSAFAKVDYGSGSPGKVWFVDSLVTGRNEDNGGVVCGGIECWFAYSEILGGKDSIKGGQYDTFYRVHAHAQYKGPLAHNDGIQTQASARDITIIQSTIDGPFGTSNAPVWISGGPISNFKVSESLIIGGTHAFKTGGDAKGCCTGVVLLDSQILADQLGTSFEYDACSTGSADDMQGEGNTATDGTKSGSGTIAGKSWSFSSCNRGPVSQANRDFFASTANKLEGWVGQIRAAAGAPSPVAASIQVKALPSPAYSATDVTVSAVVTGCSPARYDFECGDGGSFDDGSSLASSRICGKLAPGSYAVGVRASGGTCEAPISSTTRLTVNRPPAPVLH